MKDLKVVKIRKPGEYHTYGKVYGILQDMLEDTAVINFDGNCGGLCVNIAHEDYSILPDHMWKRNILTGEIVITCCGEYMPTGMIIWDI